MTRRARMAIQVLVVALLVTTLWVARSAPAEAQDAPPVAPAEAVPTAEDPYPFLEVGEPYWFFFGGNRVTRIDGTIVRKFGHWMEVRQPPEPPDDQELTTWLNIAEAAFIRVPVDY